MNNQQADDVIAEAKKWLESAGHNGGPPARLLAALVELVSRQQQELFELQAQIEAGKLREAALQASIDGCAQRVAKLRAASVSHQPVDAPIAPVVVNSRDQPQDKSGQGRFLLNAYGRECWQRGYDSAARRYGAPGAPPPPDGQQEPPQEPVLRQALKEIRYICRDVELGNWFAPDAIEHIIVACESVDDQPAAEGSQPVLRRDPCGCLHDGSRIVEWCTRSGQTHEGHEEEQRTKKI